VRSSPLTSPDLTSVFSLSSVLSGWVEKKGNKTLGVAGGGWQNRFMVVRKPGNLFYFKDEDVTQEPSGQVDLTLVVNFSLKEKDDDRPSSTSSASSAESVRLDLDLADRVLKLRSPSLSSVSPLCCPSLTLVCLRFKTPAEAARWKEGLVIWKDYANDHGPLTYPSPPSSLSLTVCLFFCCLCQGCTSPRLVSSIRMVPVTTTT
jgi:hypothetical protein